MLLIVTHGPFDDQRTLWRIWNIYLRTELFLRAYHMLLEVLRTFYQNKKKVVALFLCAFPLHIVWRVASRLHCPTTLPLTYVRESGMITVSKPNKVEKTKR